MRNLCLVFLLGCTAKPVDPPAGPPVQLTPASSASAFVPSAAPAKAGDPPSTVVFRLERGTCYGTCPSYSVRVHADGVVSYHGEAFVQTKGEQTGHVDVAKVNALVDTFERERFFDLTWDQDCKMIATDHSTVKIGFAHGAKARLIEDYLGNRCIPEQLRELEKRVDELAETARWVRCDAKGGCPR